jgi:hypothetical protein
MLKKVVYACDVASSDLDKVDGDGETAKGRHGDADIIVLLNRTCVNDLITRLKTDRRKDYGYP